MPSGGSPDAVRLRRQRIEQHDLVSIGMGLTPVVAVDLEKDGKGSVKEIISVVRTFARLRPFTIRLESGARRSFGSLPFANIAEMANYATRMGVRFPER